MRHRVFPMSLSFYNMVYGMLVNDFPLYVSSLHQRFALKILQWKLIIKPKDKVNGALDFYIKEHFLEGIFGIRTVDGCVCVWTYKFIYSVHTERHHRVLFVVILCHQWKSCSRFGWKKFKQKSWLPFQFYT